MSLANETCALQMRNKGRQAYFTCTVLTVRSWLDDRTVQCEHINHELWLYMTDYLLVLVITFKKGLHLKYSKAYSFYVGTFSQGLTLSDPCIITQAYYKLRIYSSVIH